MTQVKICCIQTLAEAEMALKAGATALGLVATMPSGPGPIPDTRIAEIAAVLDAFTVLLTSETQADDIIAHMGRCPTKAVQLVDRVAPRDIALIRAAFPDRKIIQVVHVNAMSSRAQALEAAQSVDMILLDSGSPNKRVKELGGTGRVHDWRISAEIVRESPVPVWLAGGLRVGNVAEAIQQVRPYGVDLCSSLRPKGDLDKTLLDRFMAEVKNA